MNSIPGRFKTTLEAHGLRAAIRWLNDRVPYRFTAIFAFDGDMLRSICLVDKKDQTIANCSDQPITESYCMYIHHSHETFSVDEALVDGRVALHPKRQTVQCYYGVPLFDPAGKMLGTVCHFDYTPIRVTEDIASVLDDVGPVIAEAAFGKQSKSIPA